MCARARDTEEEGFTVSLTHSLDNQSQNWKCQCMVFGVMWCEHTQKKRRKIKNEKIYKWHSKVTKNAMNSLSRRRCRKCGNLLNAFLSPLVLTLVKTWHWRIFLVNISLLLCVELHYILVFFFLHFFNGGWKFLNFYNFLFKNLFHKIMSKYSKILYHSTYTALISSTKTKNVFITHALRKMRLANFLFYFL